MSKVITFSTVFPSYHPKKGDYTYFVEKFLKSKKIEYNYCVHEHSGYSFWSLNRGKEEIVDDFIKFKFSDPFDFEPKNHTIRKGRRWKTGDMASIRIWGDDVNPKSGRSGAYHSKQIVISPDVEVTVFDFEIRKGGYIFIDNKMVQSYDYDIIAKNDGLSEDDLLAWFKYPKEFVGQIICWNNEIKY
jgi:hypothetical protein